MEDALKAIEVHAAEQYKSHVKEIVTTVYHNVVVNVSPTGEITHETE